jgi:hypothetical protein
LWAIFVYIAVRGLKTEIPDPRFASSLDVKGPDHPAAMKILLPIDGSAASVAAVQEVAHCPVPPGSTIQLLYAILNRTGFIGGPLPREDGAHATSQQVLPGAA